MHNYKDLVVWQKSIELVSDIYRIISDFPGNERYGLTSQMRSSAVSISSNIAEGSGRKSNKELANFLSISLGSQYELETQLIISQNLGLLSENSVSAVFERLSEIQKITYKLIEKYSNDASPYLTSKI